MYAVDSRPNVNDTIQPIFSCTSSKSAERQAELLALLHVLDDPVEDPLRPADRPRAERQPPVVEDVHRDPEALAGLAQHVLRRHADVVEVELAQVVRAQAHRVVALADLEPGHVRLEDQRDVAVLAVHLGARERDDHARLRPVADVALVAVQLPRAVRLEHRARVHVVHVGAGARLRQRERGELAASRQVRQVALLLQHTN